MTICLLVGLSFQKAEIETQGPTSLVKHRKGKQVVDDSKDIVKVEKWQWCLEGPLSLGMGEASSRVISAPTGGP